MDRRRKKTREAIFAAFGRLLRTKKYDHITVQEIIDEADVGRSTFYAHFETKEALLKAMCAEIFDHVFADDFMAGETCPYPYEHRQWADILAHILYHLKESRTDMSGLLMGSSGEHFMSYFKEYIYEMFSEHFRVTVTAAPGDFVLNHLTGSFAEAVRWWMRGGMRESPEQIAGYYMAALGAHGGGLPR